MFLCYFIIFVIENKKKLCASILFKKLEGGGRMVVWSNCILQKKMKLLQIVDFFSGTKLKNWNFVIFLKPNLSNPAVGPSPYAGTLVQGITWLGLRQGTWASLFRTFRCWFYLQSSHLQGSSKIIILAPEY